MANRIQGANLLKNCETRRKQMRYILENMNEPDFALIECQGSLNGTFNIEDQSENLNTAGITWRILNSQGFGNADHKSNAQPTWGSVANFMASIQDYLPKSLRTSQNPYRLWSRFGFKQSNQENIPEETQELLNDMCDWLERMKRKIQDYITAHFWREGRPQMLEFLKRRFKDEWSERTEQKVEADIETDVQVILGDWHEEGSV